MAVFSEKCGGFSGRNTSIDLMTLEILDPPPHTVPPGLRKCLKKHQEAMLAAWESVIVSKVEDAAGGRGEERE